MKRAVCMLLAAFSLSGVTAVTARADEGGLANNEGTALVKKGFTAKSGEIKIEAAGGTTVKCKESTATGEVVATEHAEETVHLKGCKSAFLACKGGKEAKAEELVVLIGLTTRRASQPEGEEDLLNDIREEHFEPGVFSFECGGGVVKAQLKGGYLVPAGASGKLAKTYSFTAQEEKGTQKPLENETEEKEIEKASLEVSINGGAFEKAGVSGTQEVTFEEEAKFSKAPEFRVTNTSPNKRVKEGTEQSFKIKNISGINNNTMESLEIVQMGFEHNAAEAKACAEKMYAVNGTCTFKTKYPEAVNGFTVSFVDDFGGGVATSTLVGE